MCASSFFSRASRGRCGASRPMRSAPPPGSRTRWRRGTSASCRSPTRSRSARASRAARPSASACTGAARCSGASTAAPGARATPGCPSSRSSNRCGTPIRYTVTLEPHERAMAVRARDGRHGAAAAPARPATSSCSRAGRCTSRFRYEMTLLPAVPGDRRRVDADELAATARELPRRFQSAHGRARAGWRRSDTADERILERACRVVPQRRPRVHARARRSSGATRSTSFCSTPSADSASTLPRRSS